MTADTFNPPYVYDKSRDVEWGEIAKIGERLVCHVCGRDYLNLQTHVWHTHGQTADEYRAEWNIRPHTPLMAGSVLEKLSHATRTNGGAERIVKITTSRWPPGYHDARGTIAAAQVTRGKTKPQQSKGGLWATSHLLIERWRAGLPIDDQLEAVAKIVER